jgi:hypothetical protein
MDAAIGRCCTVLLVLAAAVSATGDDAPRERQDLTLSWSDPQRALPNVVMGELTREAEALFLRWGVRLGTSEGVEGGDPPSIRVVLLDCTRLGTSPPRVMGQTSAARSASPAVWILVPNVRRVLDAAEGHAPQAVLARALARVVAHEVLHVLAPDLGHASSGLMRSHLRGSDLAAPWIPLDGSFRRALLDAVRPRPPEVASARPSMVDLIGSQPTPDLPAMALLAGAAEHGAEGAR